MEGSKIPPRKWLYVMYCFVTHRKGISAAHLSRNLKITWNSAHFLLNRIREAGDIVTKKLCGVAEGDECYHGGKEKNRHESKKKLHGQRGAVGKINVAGIRERGGRTILKVVNSTDSATLQGFIRQHVEKGSVVCTDEYPAYNGLDMDYDHRTVNHNNGEYVRGYVHTNGIESVWAVSKRSYHGIYHHYTKNKAQYYANETAFRMNEGRMTNDTMDSIDSLICGMVGRRLTYKMMKAGFRAHTKEEVKMFNKTPPKLYGLFDGRITEGAYRHFVENYTPETESVYEFV